jgi:hypothetical protein
LYAWEINQIRIELSQVYFWFNFGCKFCYGGYYLKNLAKVVCAPGNKLIKLELSFLESIYGLILGANFVLWGLLLEKALPCQSLCARGNKLIKLELSFLESIFGLILGANFVLWGWGFYFCQFIRFNWSFGLFGSLPKLGTPSLI